MSALFGPGRQGFLDGTINWGATPVIKCALVRGYTFNSAHQFVSEVTGAGGTLVATSAALTKTSALGVADASDVVFSTVAAGAAIPAVIVFQASAVTGGADVASSVQRLICHIDTATGLPVTPNGQNITVAWDNGSNKIFVL
jgi:hypothetical protein